MKVLILDAAADAAARTAGLVAEALAARPDSVLGLATGETMRPVYAHLVAARRAGAVSFAGVTTFNLDEYVGVGPGHPASFAAFMRETLFGLVDIDPARAHLTRC